MREKRATVLSQRVSSRWRVPEGGIRLREALAAMQPGRSGKWLKQMLELHGVEVNGAVERYASRRLREGDLVLLSWPEPLSEALPTLLWEDRDLLAVAKPAGVTCDAAQLRRWAVTWGPLYLVHRLDRPTSGVLLLARHAAAEKAMHPLFATRQVAKCYWALVQGVPGQSEGELSYRMRKVQELRGQQRWGVATHGGGVEAVTGYRVCASSGEMSWLECFPKTGRTHQLRVHLAHMGHPILGDAVYGAGLRGQAALRLMLHARHVRFDHPLTGELCEIKAPVPTDMEAMLRHCGWATPSGVPANLAKS